MILGVPIVARQSQFWLLLLTMLVSASGASCPQFIYMNRAAGPRVLPEAPTMTDVMRVVNGNTGLVQSLYTEHASVSVPLMVSLRARLAVERPRRLHLWADTRFTGPEVDLGSNDELFWFWAKRNPMPAIFYCRHDQFSTSAARSVLPVEPDWLIEALGLTTFDPNVAHRGPTPVGGRLRIETPLQTLQGPMTKVTFVDESQGWVLAQHLYDAQGKLAASAVSSHHWRDPGTGAVLPTRIELQTPATDTMQQFSLRLELNDLQVNKLTPNPQLWTMPTIEGFTPLNLADPNLRVGSPPAAGMPAGAPASVGAPAGAARPLRPQVRY
ncbi:MAG TPA: hypothetical protein VHA76_10870 [Solirubrobacterales bacterium]|nr:hypothetical protein [Solirubrobacterales bacterium]